VQNIFLTPNGATPKLQWTWPTGYAPNMQSIFIYNKSLQTPNHVAPLVYGNNNIGLAKTWTAPVGVFGPGGSGPHLPLTDNYMISIQLDQTNPSLPNPEDLEGRSRTFVDFNIASFGTSTSPVYVPTIASDGVSQFDISVTTGQIYSIDP
jgi:hypothetical protein